MTTTISALDLPFEEAIAYLRQKANVTSQDYTDVWGRANTRSFTVAGATTEALVSDFRTEVAKALEKGTSLGEFRKSFDSLVTKHGWDHTGKPGWRARIIYETNLGMAYSAGRYAQQTEPETLAAFPFWEYVHSGALHPRKQHLAWNGLTLRADDPFWQTHYPPNGWRCGCRTRPVSARGLQRMGKSGPDTAPPLRLKEYTNRKTGEVFQVPEGIDPGFDYSPGQEWTGKAPVIPANATLRPPSPRVPKQKSLPFDPPLPEARPPAPAPTPSEERSWPWPARPRQAKFRLDVDRRATDFGLFKTDAQAREIAAELMAGIPDELQVAAEWRMRSGGSLSLSVDHREARLVRSFWRENGALQVEHDYFWLASRHQGGGHALRMMQTAMHTYDRLGVARVHVHANLDKGGYVWARSGFAARDAWEMRDMLAELADELPPMRRRRLKEVLDAADDVHLMYDVATLSDATGNWGKPLLLGSDWFGIADLTDAAQRKLLKRALAR